jgi:hypothetical protein
MGIQCQYDQMRIMANAISKGGNFTMTCSVLGPGTIMAPLDVNLNYADDALHKALIMKNPQWMKERDRETRTLMISYIQDGMSQGAALQKAWSENHFEWKDSTLEKDIGKRVPSRNPNGALALMDRDRSPLKRRGGKKRSHSSSSSRSPPPSARNRGGKANKKKKDKKATPKHKFGTSRPGDGKKTCSFWNKGKCNKGEDCPDVHNYCNRLLRSGGMCGEDHPGNRCTNPNRVK